MASPGGEPPTLLDPGRQPLGAVDVTELDPGRSRARPAGPSLAEGLPPLLDERFDTVRVLSRDGAEADIFLVRERSTGDERVVKLYRDATRDRRMQAFLRMKQSPYSVRVLETGTEADRDYEVMEHLAGGSLADLRDANPAGLDAAALTALVRQLAAALAELHEAGFVHRDVKPSNIMVRALTPLEVALIDFGISLHLPEPTTIGDDSGSVRFMPPEFLGGRWLSPAYDWWGLGLTVRELAIGEPLLVGAMDDEVRRHVVSGPIGVQRIVDPRIRLLCQGLLAQEDALRWGADEVGRWLGGDSPPVPQLGASDGAGAQEVEVDEPYRYLDTDYFNRGLLAAHMTATWETAAGQLYRTGSREPPRRLEEWLRQYHGDADGSDNAKEPDDVRLLRVLRRMAPSHPPVYREINISVQRLPALARDAERGVGNLPQIVEELSEYELLPLLSHGSAAVDLDGGDGLGDVHTKWREQRKRWRDAISDIPDQGARLVLRRRDAESRRRVLALCLWAVVADDHARAEVRRNLEAQARTVRLDWFTELVRDPDLMWIAHRLREYADDVAAERDEQVRAEEIRRRWLARNRRLREWSRRQNRPLALSWAVAGVFVMAVVCALLISVSDIVGAVSAGAIVDAWVATAFSTAAALTFESALAWEIGGRFHPRYSMLGAGLIALGRGARSVAGRGIALAVVSGVLGGAYLLTAFAPAATPLAAGGGVMLWTVARYLRWSADWDREQAEADQGARELLATARP